MEDMETEDLVRCFLLEFNVAKCMLAPESPSPLEGMPGQSSKRLCLAEFGPSPSTVLLYLGDAVAAPRTEPAFPFLPL